MQLQGVKVTNAQGSILELLLEAEVGFLVKNIEGLGPVKATLVSTSFANLDGAQYHSSRREPRNIVLTLGLEPDYAVESVHALREQLYNFFMPKTSCVLAFHMFDKFSDNIIEQTQDRTIEGRVESCDPSIFTKDPAMDISVMCFNPDLVDLTPVTVDGITFADLTETVIPYEGTVETGVLFTFRPDRDINEFTIFHRAPDGSLTTVDFSYPLIADDLIEISSVQGSKYVKLTRAGVERSILYAVSPQSGWLELQPGDNSIRVYALGTPIHYSIDYTTKYGGI